ncbi:MAG TPA: amidase [Steroidobacteraceae bacterium]|nr:amidase [Steroidobacteraceae bacterium]
MAADDSAHTLTRRTFSKLAGSAVASAMFSPAQSSAAPAQASELAGLTIAEASRRIRDHSVTPTELTEACLARIDLYDRKLNAFITVTADLARAQARALDAEQRAGKVRGPLHGIPVAVKDSMDTAGIRTTLATAQFKDRIPMRDAAVVERLRAAGAVLVGKTNLHEMAWGAGDISYYGPVRNPWSLDRGTGGSSSGSAAAVAASLCFSALGTDTAASIRQPASLCGLVGLKPTFGLVSMRGITALVDSLEHCGPLTRTVEDAAIMLDHLAGYDRLDPVSVEQPAPNYAAAVTHPVSEFRLGLPDGYFDNLDPEVAEAINRAIALLKTMTKGAKPTQLPSTKEFSAGGALGAETYAIHETFLKTNPDGYSPVIRARLEAEAGIRAADYIRTRRALERLRRTIDETLFTDVDLLVLPTERGLPPLLNEMIHRSMHPTPGLTGLAGTGTANLSPFDAFGIPAISVPCGLSQGGLPIGLQIVGPRFSEAKVLALAAAYERASHWTSRRPPLTAGTPVPEVTGYAWHSAPALQADR